MNIRRSNSGAAQSFDKFIDFGDQDRLDQLARFGTRHLVEHTGKIFTRGLGNTTG